MLHGAAADAAAQAEAQVLRVVAGDRALAREEALTARGYPAFPLTLLTPLGAEIRSETDAVVVTLFGDTLRFRAGQAAFWADGQVEPLYSWSFENDEVLFVAPRFFTEWLPRRYPDRLSYADSTLRFTSDSPEVIAYRWPTALRSVPAEPAREPDSVPASTAQRTSGPRPWSLYAVLYNVFDSNIDHNQDDVDSYGILFGIGGRYRNRSSIGTVELLYDGVVREYTNTDQWSVPGHQAELSFERRVTRHLSLEVVAEASMNGSTEDRVLRDEYSVEPRIEYRFDPQNRVRLYAEYLLKRYPDPTTGQNAVDPRLGMQFRHILGDDGSWTLGARYEVNQADSTRYRYTAWTFHAEVASAIGARTRAWWSVRYRARSYTSRLITSVDDTEVLRRDDGWIAATTWEYSPRNGWIIGLIYRYELYDSNDPRRKFRAHTVALSWKHGWW